MISLKKSSYLFVLILTILLMVNNTIYYFNTKTSLEQELFNKLEHDSKQIELSLERARQGVSYVDSLVNERLRADSLIIKQALGPDIHNITNQQLVLLAKELNLRAISLLEFKQDQDAFMVTRTSDEKELSLNTTKSWGLWNTAFLELYRTHEVTIPWGQSLSHFWAGPYSISAINKKETNKYVYYYDGTTNYIINPYITDENYIKYDIAVGSTSTVNSILASTPYLLEIYGINPATFGQNKDLNVQNQAGETYQSKFYLPIFFGKNEYKSEQTDTSYIQKAIESKKSAYYHTEIDGKHVFKTFIPIYAENINDILSPGDGVKAEKLDYYVMGITADYGMVQSQLNSKLIELLIVMFAVTLISIVMLIILNHYFMKSKDFAVSQTQATYINELDQLFRTIRGQRHDFLNHLNIIQAFVKLGKKEELAKYTEEMIGEVIELNDIINIGQPAVAALVQSKTIAAANKGIQFKHAFHDMNDFPTGLKSVDIVRVVGNLIDNAFDEVSKLPPEERIVELNGSIADKKLQITVRNPGTLTEEQKRFIFEPGFTTKMNGEHSGLGLSITKDIVKKYKGDIGVNIENEISFYVTIPIT
jgi:hypothetical protein